MFLCNPTECPVGVFFCPTLSWFLSYSLFVSSVSGAVIPDGTRYVYSRDMLLQMNCASTRVMDFTLQLPAFIPKCPRKAVSLSINGTRKKRKLGKRGGASHLTWNTEAPVRHQRLRWVATQDWLDANTWILECLELYNINGKLRAFIKNSLELWTTTLDANSKPIAQVMY